VSVPIILSMLNGSIEVYLRLEKTRADPRLKALSSDSGWGRIINYYMELKKPEDIDAIVVGWLKEPYDASA
jgi:hypothetical protein